MSKAVTCVVADDHPAVVAAVRDVLQAAGLSVVGQARDGAEALAQIEARRPDVALVDVRMPKLGGIEVARRSAKVSPATAVVLYTAYGDRALLTEALDAGARGFVLKEAPLTDLARATELVASGGTYVDPVLAGNVASATMNDTTAALTLREREVLRLLAEGFSNEEVGSRLFISPETVRTHVRKAMGKLGAGTRTQAVATAMRNSLIA